MKKIFIPLKSYLLKQHHSNHFRTILLHLLELVYYVHMKTTMSLDQIFNIKIQQCQYNLSTLSFAEIIQLTTSLVLNMTQYMP